ncbi:MAG: 1-deoxy-D-xylulose-5-phosphate synthase, partial [Tannerella sp.]|nr:1-deoxy-D-xylulose-5-phosphate synthase [Tannerella sp.]
DVETGQRVSERALHFNDVFGDTLVTLAEKDERITGVTPAMPTGCSMYKMMNRFPERVFDVGIAEGHAVTFSAGLAKEGVLPFCNIYSTFMQRAYDEVIHDAALQNLHLVLCLDRAGLVGEDGPTHHGVFDLAYMRPVPGLTIAAPTNEEDLRNMMFTASRDEAGLFVIRYPKGRCEPMEDKKAPMKVLTAGKGRKLRDGEDVAVLSVGPIRYEVAKAVDMLPSKDTPSVAHYDMLFVKPLDEELLHEVGRRFKRIITIEDGVRTGGFGSAVCEFMTEQGYSPKIERIGVPDRFIEHGTVGELHALCGMDAAGIIKTIIPQL